MSIKGWRMIGNRVRERHQGPHSLTETHIPEPFGRESRAIEPVVQTGGVNVAFREPIHKILKRIKNEPYF